MRILEFITSLRLGGAERLVTDLAVGFKEEGHDVVVALLDGTRTSFHDELEAKGVRIISLAEGAGSMRNPFLGFRLVRLLGKERFDVIHTHNSACQFLAAFASLFLRLRLVTTEHNTSNRRRAWGWFKPLDRWMYSRYSRIICVGDEVRRNLEEYLGDAVAGKTVIIRNGVDLDRFRNAVPDPGISSLPGHKIVMVAAFRSQKDQATLIRAIALLPSDYQLFLVGGVEWPEDQPNLDSCKALVRELGLESRVHFLGKRGDVSSILAASDVVVLSTHYEGMSLSVIEGMASGRPFVASDVAGVRDMVGVVEALFPESDAGALAGVLRKVCEDKALGDNVTAQCMSLASKYSIEASARRYLFEYA
ncbi:MAG: glycosyltransferase [Bacteroidales bacterium]|nr:glycosyltransferase [Bacteroidales bacterium]